MTALFLPIAFGIRFLYSWSDPQNVAHDEILQHKHLYLNVPFFLARAVLYFVVWNALIYFLNQWSLGSDRVSDRVWCALFDRSASSVLAGCPGPYLYDRCFISRFRKGAWGVRPLRA